MNDVAVAEQIPPRRRRRGAVTYELADRASPLRRLLVDLEFEPVVAELRADLVAQASTATVPAIAVPSNLASLVGSAADIRLRWWLRGVGDVMPTATAGIAMLSPTGMATIGALLDPVEGVGSGDLPKGLEAEVCRAALAVASAEVLGRIGRAVPIPVDEMDTDEFLQWSAPGCDALVEITARFGDVLEPLLPGDTIDLGPIVGFPGLSGDADVVIDGTLVEVKCISDIRREATPVVRQLLVYGSLLNEIPHSVAAAFFRQGVLTRFDTTPFHDELAELGNAIRHEYSHPATPNPAAAGPDDGRDAESRIPPTSGT